MTDTQYSKMKAIAPDGFYMIKEYQKWGDCPTFRNDSGKCLFWQNGRFLTGPEMYAYLYDNWRPVALAEQNYFCNGMKELLNL